MASSIEWLNGGDTWNPIRARLKNGHPVKAAVPQHKQGWACVRISPGCEHCYSEKQNMQCGTNRTRLGTGMNYTVPSLDMVEIYLDQETLLQPLHWKKPRLIFPCSMTDWMADFVPDEFRYGMLAVMALTPQHTYLSLTKRADLQLEFMNDPETRQRVAMAIMDIVVTLKPRKEGIPIPIEHRPDSTEMDPRFWAIWPLPNLWLGTSTENQKYADERIPLLLQTPAAVRWVSAEPLLGPIDLATPFRMREGVKQDALYGSDGIRWVVAGGESGPKARPCNIEWIRSLIAQCKAAGVPIFVKQLGAKPYLHKQNSINIQKPGISIRGASFEIESSIQLNDPKGGDPAEWPADLRVREYPEARKAVCA